VPRSPMDQHGQRSRPRARSGAAVVDIRLRYSTAAGSDITPGDWEQKEFLAKASEGPPLWCSDPDARQICPPMRPFANHREDPPHGIRDAEHIKKRHF
jgi:hypothetical protein